MAIALLDFWSGIGPFMLAGMPDESIRWQCLQNHWRELDILTEFGRQIFILAFVLPATVYIGECNRVQVMTDNSNIWDESRAVQVEPQFTGPRILLKLEPEGKLLSMPRPKTAAQLLVALNVPEEGAILARDGVLLTPDRRIWPNDRIWVRIVASRG